MYILILIIIMFIKKSLSFNIYVLELVKNKFYVGKTNNNVLYRFNQHKIGIGSQWTKIYQPLKILEHFETNDNFDEDKYTKKYMNSYGIDNVRGGSYSNIKLTDWQIKTIEHELKTSNNLCFICGNPGHFASNCNYRQKILKK